MIWILLLTIWAGYINCLSLLTFSRTVGHHTGNLTYLAVSIVQGEFLSIGVILLGLVLIYILGSISSEIIFGRLTRDRRHLSKRLSFILVAIGFTLIGVNQLLPPLCLMFFFSFLMGGQNGYSLQVYNKLVRTTHLTGYLTDVGILIGQWLRDRQTNTRLLVFYLSSLVLFVVGAALAVCMSERLMWITHLQIVAIGYIVSGILLAIRTYQLVGYRK